MAKTFVQIEPPISSSSSEALAQFEGYGGVQTRGVWLPDDSAPRLVDDIVEAVTPVYMGKSGGPIRWQRTTRIVTPATPHWFDDLSTDDPRALARQARISAQAPRRFRDVWGVLGFTVGVQDALGGFVVLPLPVPVGVQEIDAADNLTGTVLRAERWSAAALLPWSSIDKASRELPPDLYFTVLDSIYMRRMLTPDEAGTLAKRLAVEAAADERMLLWEADSVRFRLETISNLTTLGLGAHKVPHHARNLGMVDHFEEQKREPEYRFPGGGLHPVAKALAVSLQSEPDAPLERAHWPKAEPARMIVVDTVAQINAAMIREGKAPFTAEELAKAADVAQSFGVAVDGLPPLEPPSPTRTSPPPAQLVDTGTAPRFSRDEHTRATAGMRRGKPIRLTFPETVEVQSGPFTFVIEGSETVGASLDRVAKAAAVTWGAVDELASTLRARQAPPKLGGFRGFTLESVIDMVQDGHGFDDIIAAAPVTLPHAMLKRQVERVARAGGAERQLTGAERSQLLAEMQKDIESEAIADYSRAKKLAAANSMITVQGGHLVDTDTPGVFTVVPSNPQSAAHVTFDHGVTVDLIAQSNPRNTLIEALEEYETAAPRTPRK